MFSWTFAKTQVNAYVTISAHGAWSKEEHLRQSVCATQGEVNTRANQSVVGNQTYILCTKSPNRFKYADNLEGPPFVDWETSLSIDGDLGDGDVGTVSLSRSDFLLRTSFCGVGDSTPEVVLVGGSACGGECECECECECEWEWPSMSSSPAKTRRVFSIKKNALNPRKIPSLPARKKCQLVDTI